jgi:hypothetical protein
MWRPGYLLTAGVYLVVNRQVIIAETRGLMGDHLAGPPFSPRYSISGSRIGELSVSCYRLRRSSTREGTCAGFTGALR